MAQTTARTKKNGKTFEILVDEDLALKFRKGEGDINSVVLTESIFHNLKSGEHVSSSDLEESFGSSDFTKVCEKIIKNGEVVRTTASINSDQERKYKQVVDFLSKNATSPDGKPYTPDRISKALKEAHVNIKNKPIEDQISEITDQLSKVLPLRIETKKFKLRVPALNTGKSYGALKEFITSEEWLSNGDLECVVDVPSGLVMDFFDKINSTSHGSILSEEVKS